MTEGEISRALGVPGSPALAEDTIVARDLPIGRRPGKAWHVAHVSTRGALDQARLARCAGCAPPAK